MRAAAANRRRPVRSLLAALIVCATLAAAPAAGAEPLRYGVADDWPEWHPCGDLWWQGATDIGYQDLRLTIRWDETQPDVVPQAANLKAAVDCALLTGMRPILAVFPLRPDAIGSSVVAQAAFARFAAEVGAGFAGVRDFIVGNEPNVNRFWQPQYTSGRDAAGRDYEHTLAASYDALKRVRPDAVVWGPAVSSRGNDDPSALSNPSHSPVWFIKDLGDAYRASGRTAPIFDEFDLHPYPPVQDTAPFTKQFPWPQAGAADLDRIKQALWDAFHGTNQPVPAEHGFGRSPGAVLPIDLDEVGEQTTVVAHEPAYDGSPENVQPIDEATQALRYVRLARLGACDPDVRSILWFPLIDDNALSSGFQSGELYADGAQKLAYRALKAEIASAQGFCALRLHRWAHTTAVAGAAGVFGGPGTAPGSQPRDRPAGLKELRTAVTTGEDATYSASLVPLRGGVRVAATARSIASSRGAVGAYRRHTIRFAGPIPPGRYRIQVVVAAATNPDRTVILTSKAFQVGGRVARRP
jgi:hypothetical protein